MPLAARGGGSTPESSIEVGQRSWAKVLGPSSVLVGALAVVAYVGSVSPHTSGNYPTCPFFALTGLHCPGCGSLRALHELAHGHVTTAIGLNLVLVAVAPLLAYWWVRWACRSWTGAVRPPLVPALVGWVLLASIVMFAVARNLPVGGALAP